MAITCPQCGAEYDVTLFTFGRAIQCDCGGWVDLIVGHVQKSDAGDRGERHADTPPVADESREELR